MSTDPVGQASDAPEDGSVQCWCCDTRTASNQMVHLGNHPEVHLCLRCAHFVHQQAWAIEDRERRGPAAAARNTFRDVRAEVVRRGWHRNRVIGGRLRWIGRYLP